MRYLEPVDVNDRFVDEMWKKVSEAGSYYSIGDGVTKETFRKVLFQSALVLRGASAIFRIENNRDFVEVHPIVFGHSFFRDAHSVLEEGVKLLGKLFDSKPICCIIPDGMKGTRHLAQIAGMTEAGKLARELSGVPISCTVFVWR